MLFKGTSHIGTTDWAKERAVLKQISDAYEERRKHHRRGRARSHLPTHRQPEHPRRRAGRAQRVRQDDQEHRRAGHQRLHQHRTHGLHQRHPQRRTGAVDAIESERMQECVLRLFHTELETVYEEFNRSQDNDGRAAYKKMNELLYPNHPYGTQTTIGTGEHLKNPSMVKIHEFFERTTCPTTWP
jgi:zinc protease